MTTNVYKNFEVQHVPTMSYDKIESDEPYSITTVSLVRDMTKSFEEFTKELETEIMSWAPDTLLGVFPEFCWRKSDPEEVFKYLEKLKSKIKSNLVLVLGTLEFTLNGKFTNNAIVLHDSKFWYIPKTKVLDTDALLGVVPGENPGVIKFPRFNLGVLVCADLWDAQLCYKLAYLQGADIIAVSSWTATRPTNRLNARRDWHALARTRSTEHSIIIAVADHMYNFPKTDVANATSIFTHDNRSKEFPCDEYIIRDIVSINLKAAKEARDRWISRGLGQTD